MSKQDLDVIDAAHEAVQPFLLVVEERVGRDDNLPAGIPDAASHQAGADELLWNEAVEEGRIVDGTKGLVLAQHPRLLGEGAVGVEEPGVVEG